MQSFLVTVASMIVGGALAGFTVYGVVSSQTSSGGENPVDSNTQTEFLVDYGSTGS